MMEQASSVLSSTLAQGLEAFGLKEKSVLEELGECGTEILQEMKKDLQDMSVSIKKHGARATAQEIVQDAREEIKGYAAALQEILKKIDIEINSFKSNKGRGQ